MDAGSKQPPADSAIHPMVLNIGRRPTVEADAEAAITVEVHIMHAFAAGFYGRHCKALVSGFIRCACFWIAALVQGCSRAVCCSLCSISWEVCCSDCAQSAAVTP